MIWPIYASVATGVAKKLGGGGRLKMDPESMKLYKKLMAMYKGNVPDWLMKNVTAPYTRAAKGIKQHYGRQAGSSGLKHAILQRQAYTPESQARGQAAKGYKTDILDQARMVLSGAQHTQEQGWGDMFGDIGGDIGYWLGMKDVFGLEGDEDKAKEFFNKGSRADAVRRRFGGTGSHGFSGW